jgi:hypothetical protein
VEIFVDLREGWTGLACERSCDLSGRLPVSPRREERAISTVHWRDAQIPGQSERLEHADVMNTQEDSVYFLILSFLFFKW